MGIKIDTSTTNATSDTSKSAFDVESFLKKDIISLSAAFSNKKKEEFYRSLHVLLSSGIDLKQSLELVADGFKKEKDKERITALGKAIVSGKSFSKAMQDDAVFSPYEYRSIEVGEQTGELALIAENLHTYFEQSNELKRQIISALTYPFIVLLTALLVVFFMLNYVVPMFEDIFKQNQVDLPWITSVLISLSHFLRSYWKVILILLVGMYIGYRIVRKKAYFKKASSQFLLKLPIIGNYLKKVYLTRFMQTMTLLVKARIPISNAISTVKDVIPFYPLQQSLALIELDILKGERLSDSFSKRAFFDKKTYSLIKVAEETNQTTLIFENLYHQYLRETKYQAQVITNVLNPLLTIIVGLLVGVILIAMYLPMFRLSSLIG